MTNLVEKLGLAALYQLDPERAHGLALRALNTGLVPLPEPVTSPRLATRVAGLTLPNPIGLAAGFDKNATSLAALARAGFGFLEVGAVTPRPQPGNPKPRLFRLKADGAAINRFGFNNEGMQTVGQRLAARPKGAVIGLNLGANKDSADKAEDFARVLAHCAPLVDFATVNVSSPNTENLRDLQGKAALAAVLDRVLRARDDSRASLPVFLKIAPDLSTSEIDDIVEVAQNAPVDAIIATNTTLAREGLKSAHAHEAGGLSGRPLFAPSTRILAALSARTQIPLIGVGGIASAEDAYAKIRAGASAVQLYTGLVYQGLSLVGDMARGLERLLARDGFDHVAQAVGSDRDRWL